MNAEFEKCVFTSLYSIKNFKEETALIVKSSESPINNCIAISRKEKDCFEIKFIINEDKLQNNNYYFDNLKFKQKILLQKGGKTYCIGSNSVTEVSVSMSQPKIITIKTENFQTLEDKHFDNQHLRLVIPTSQDVELQQFEYYTNKIGSCVTVSGLFVVEINNNEYHVFKHSNDDTEENFLFIDSVEKDYFENFKTNTSAILLSIGLINGNYYLNEHYIQIIENNEEYKTTQIVATAYFKKEESIINNVNLFNKRDFNDYLRYLKREDLIVKNEVVIKNGIFNEISKQIIKNKIFERCIKLLIEGTQTKRLLLRASIYSIALETLTEFISKKESQKIKPIKDKKIFKEIRLKLIETITDYSDEIDDYGCKILNAKINNLNTPTNAKKLQKPFEIYNINLSKLEIEILNHRNKFLHGLSPIDNEKDEDLRLSFISKKMFTLCTSLIMKYCGYSGHIKDFSGYHQLNFEEKVTEHLFKIL